MIPEILRGKYLESMRYGSLGGAPCEVGEWFVLSRWLKQEAARSAAFDCQTFYFYCSELDLINMQRFFLMDVVEMTGVVEISRGLRA